MPFAAGRAVVEHVRVCPVLRPAALPYSGRVSDSQARVARRDRDRDQPSALGAQTTITFGNG